MACQQNLDISSQVLLKNVLLDHKQTAILFIGSRSVIAQKIFAGSSKGHCIM